jgi:DNA polymerase II large subunit
MKGKIARKDKETNDIKRKVEISENNYKKLRDEVMRLQLELELRKKINAEKQDTIAKNSIILNAVDAEKTNSEL